MAITITTQHNDQYEPTGAALPPGYYPAMIFEYEETQTQKNNPETGRPDPMIVLTIGVYADEDRERKHLHILSKYYIVIREKGQWRLEQAMKACAVKFDQGQRISIDERMFRGARVAVRTSINISDRGGRFIKVDALLARDKVPHWGELSPDECKQFNIDADGVVDGNNVTRKSRPAYNSTPQRNDQPPAPAYTDEADEDFTW